MRVCMGCGCECAPLGNLMGLAGAVQFSRDLRHCAAHVNYLPFWPKMLNVLLASGCAAGRPHSLTDID